MKTRSTDLNNHLIGFVTTTCYLMKIGPLPDDSFITLTSHNRNVPYDDGDGLKTYQKSTGTQLSNFENNSDLTVVNGEAKSLMQQYPNTGITQVMIEDNTLSGVEYVIYKINYLAPSMGHELVSSGPIGEVRMNREKLIMLELRAWTDLLRQNSVCERDSLTCRAKHFGSQVGDELFPCMKNISGMWVNDVVVTSIGPENVREFTASGLTGIDNFYAPGLVEWTEGDNAGVSSEVEGFLTGGAIDLKFALRHAIQVNDKFNIRPDCTREFDADNVKINSCMYHANIPWFRGEPYIPVSDVIALTVPGAVKGGY